MMPFSFNAKAQRRKGAEKEENCVRHELSFAPVQQKLFPFCVFASLRLCVKGFFPTHDCALAARTPFAS